MQIEQWRRLELEDRRAETRIRLEFAIDEENTFPRRAEREKLALRGISKHFRVRGGFVEALSNVTLTVFRGEFVCLVGPSGCGKSTLLNIIAGLERPSGGEILADGRPVYGAGPDRIIMFQEPALFPWLTVQQNVEFGLKIRNVPREERARRAMNGLALVGLAEFARSYVHQLSGGMKQRAALARALVLDPDLLLLDEPFASLDAQTREVLHDELTRIWSKTGKTIVFVTHNVQEALRLADRILVFSARPGRITREFPLPAVRPREVEQGSLGEIGEAIRHELRLALSTAPRGGGVDAPRPGEIRFLPDVDCSLGGGR